MPEAFLHYIWQQKLFLAFPQNTTDGLPVEVINVGMYNATESGPDFFNAKVRIGNNLLVGNVEIHIKASDWNLHHHNNDPAYDNVILHVVQEADTTTHTTQGLAIPTCRLQFNPNLLSQYLAWQNTTWQIPCADKLDKVPAVFVTNWKEALLLERLARKTQEIEDLLTLYHNSWEDAFYVSLGRNFGFHTNSQPFEMLAKSIPLQAIGRHRDNLLQVEALLFGQAGLLDKTEDDYTRTLLREYKILQAKFQLTPIPGHLWKMRLRPDNFPHVRIAQFAQILHHTDHLFRAIQEATDAKQLHQLFQVQCSNYWDTHYRFGNEGGTIPKTLGKTSIDIILINTVAPYLFLYAKHTDRPELLTKALKMLDSVPAERNAQIDLWKKIGISAKNAADSQALLQLRQHYCDQRRCLQCRFGLQIFKHL